MFGSSRRPDSRAFQELLDALKAYEKKFLHRRFLKGDTELADGYRAMLDLLGTGLDCYVHNDPERPRFVSLVSPIRKIGGDNADALYFFAPLTAGRRYRLRGTMGSAVYLAFTVYGGEDPQKFHIVSNLSTPELKVEDDGSFELRIEELSERAAQDTVVTDGTANCLIVRRYYLDKDAMLSDSGEQTIEPEVPPAPPPLLSGQDMQRQLESLTSFLKGWFDLTPLPMPPVALAYNRLSKPKRASADTGHWSTPDNIHSFGFFRVKQGESLLIRGRSPQCLYWSVHLWNPFMQTFDYAHHPCAINSADVTLEADGSWELCVAHEDLGHPNWISTTGRERGFIYFRWLQAESLPDKPELVLRKRRA
jgi:hypothetical protein